MFGSGLHFNSPGVVRVQKTFGIATDPAFDWTLIGPAYHSQNIITTLPLTGPSLIPFLVMVSGVAIDKGVAGLLLIYYYGDSTISAAALYSIPLLGNISEAYSTYPLEKSNFDDGATVWPIAANRTTNSGIIISSDSPWTSGTSLTVTLYCVNSGLNY